MNSWAIHTVYALEQSSITDHVHLVHEFLYSCTILVFQTVEIFFPTLHRFTDSPAFTQVQQPVPDRNQHIQQT